MLDYARLTERPEILDMIEKMRAGVKVEVPKPSDNERDETIHIT